MTQALVLAALGTGFTFGMTALGACVVFLFRRQSSPGLHRVMLGFAAGVMLAASVWSLLIPSIEKARELHLAGWLPAAGGSALGIAFLLAMDALLPHLAPESFHWREGQTSRRRTLMLVLAVTLHNIPEGMAVGVVYAGFRADSASITAAGALVLALGIAIQNFPEGAIVSMPLRAEGVSKGKAFWGGMLSGVVEPIAAVITLLLAEVVLPALPYLRAFAAGAMIYVVVEELIPEMSQGEKGHSNIGTVSFALGFTIMMALDLALG